MPPGRPPATGPHARPRPPTRSWPGSNGRWTRSASSPRRPGLPWLPTHAAPTCCNSRNAPLEQDAAPPGTADCQPNRTDRGQPPTPSRARRSARRRPRNLGQTGEALRHLGCSTYSLTLSAGRGSGCGDDRVEVDAHVCRCRELHALFRLVIGRLRVRSSVAYGRRSWSASACSRTASWNESSSSSSPISFS